jgi:pyruvate,water dikinase
MDALNTYIINLADLNCKFEDIGNKAINLNRLIQHDFCVPEGFVIKTGAYDLFLNHNNLKEFIQETLDSIDYNSIESIKNAANIISNSFDKSTIPKEIINSIKLKFQEFSSFPVAVRSSAIAEDLPLASFAGQYDSFLNLINVDQVILCIKKIYMSLWSDRALLYRYKNKIPHNIVKIAVIIQKMVQSKSAGVLFTLNPLTYDKTEILIESNFGLGESIVSGRSSPDQFFIQKSKSGLLKIVTKRIGVKKLITNPKSIEEKGGIEYIEISTDLSQKSSLSENLIIKLAETGIKVEKKFNRMPQDIEWAIDQNNQIYILQTRPVTGLREETKNPEILWSRGYSDDYWNDNVTPLFFELLGDQITKVVNIELNSIMGYHQMDLQLLKLYNAHVYFNLNVIKRKIEYEIPKFMRNEDILNYFPEGTGSYGKKTMKDLPFHLIKRIVAELRVMLYDPNGSMSKTAKAYEEWTKEVFTAFRIDFNKKLINIVESGKFQDLLDLANELDRIMINHFRLIRYGIPVHNIGMNLLIQYLLKRFLGKEKCSRYYPILVSGLEHKLTETNDKVYYLASIVNESTDLKNIILNIKSEQIYETILKKGNPSIKKFLIEFEKFLNGHGDRGFSRDIYYPRWREKPMANIFDILKSLVMDEWQDLRKLKKKNLRKRELVEKLVETEIRKQRLGIFKWKFFSIILKNSRRYIVFRENQRFNLDKWITMNRNLFLEIGKHFVKQEIIPDKEKVFFLYKKEIKKLLLNKYNKKEIEEISLKSEERYKDFIRNENSIPPKFILGTKEFNDILKHNKESKRYIGIPASQGIITAPLRIIEDIELISTVKSGEILVVPRTDPGWTPIFSKIGGLITETGGILSHGAVVSREYGIPAVTNITNACKIFQTGQIIKINGFKGIVIPKSI